MWNFLHKGDNAYVYSMADAWWCGYNGDNEIDIDLWRP